LNSTTALAGLPVYLDLVRVLGLTRSIEKHLKIRENSQEWTDVQAVTSLVFFVHTVRNYGHFSKTSPGE